MATQQTVQKEKTKPEAKFWFQGVTATVWCNTNKDAKGNEFVVRNVNLSRSYKDKDGNWQNTDSIKGSDLPKAILALQKAYEHCLTAKNQKDDEE
jgi:hypothetical protein